jgi:hypothetical protein
MSRSLIATPTLALLLVAGCGTKVVELAPDDARRTEPGDALPIAFPSCVQETDPKGILCIRCTDKSGVEVKAACSPAPAAAGSTPSPACVVKPDAVAERCVICGSEPRGCLECAPRPPNGTCRTCVWSDLPDKTSSCLQCFDASGAPIPDKCDELRTDLAPNGG